MTPLQGSRVGATAFFAINGILGFSFVPRLAEIQADLGLDAAGLGVVLAVVATIPFGLGWLVLDRALTLRCEEEGRTVRLLAEDTIEVALSGTRVPRTFLITRAGAVSEKQDTSE